MENAREEATLITVDELAEILRVPRGWIYERTRLGKIPHVRLGRLVRFKASEVISHFERKASNDELKP